MYCPRCESRIQVEDANLDTLVARCRRCNEVFRFDDQLAPRSSAPPARLRTPRPGRLVVEDQGDVRSLSWTWFRFNLLFMIFFCIAWDSFLVFWYWAVLTQEFSWIMALFPVCHVAVGVGLTYATVASLFNGTRITVDYDRLTIHHGPVPWPGNASFDKQDLCQLYCDHTTTTNDDTTTTTYNVNAVDGSGRRVVLLKGLDDRGMALFIEDQLEEWLGIRPERVPGELSAVGGIGKK
jgi:hypothetical protein